MPNWTTNGVKIHADPDLLLSIASSNFDFQIIHPCPFIKGEKCEEGWYEWCYSHWGTKWSARYVDIDYAEGETVLTASFNTAWSAPHGVLAYITELFPEAKITNTWQDECCERVGITTYHEGTITSTSIDPTEYTKETLEAFSDSNLWFDYEECVAYRSDEYEDLEEEDNELLTCVKPKVWSLTYEEFVAAHARHAQ